MAFWLVLIFFSTSAAPGTYKHRIQYIIDKNLDITAEKILEGYIPLKYSETSTLNFNYTDSPVWILLEKNLIRNIDIITLENTHIDSATFYHIKNGRIKRHNIQGDRVPFSNRHIAITRINEKVFSDTDSLLIRIKSQGPLLVPIRLFTNQEIFPYYQNQHHLHFIYFGIVLLAFVVNLFFYLRLKEVNFIYYSLCLLSLCTVILIENGYMFQYLWPESPGINGFTPTIYSLSVFVILFMERFLRIREYCKKLFAIFVLFYLLHAIIVLLNISGFFNGASLVYLFFWLFFPFFIFSISLHFFFKKKVKEVTYILFAWTTLMIAIVIYILSLVHILPHTFLTTNILPIASSIEVIFLFLAVANRFELIKKEKEQILYSQNKILEERLWERTKEITSKNNILQSQNQELLHLKEKLQEQRDILSKKNKMIQEKNIILNDKQITLEEIVNSKTKAILKANKDLEDRNKRLQQFTYIASHNLRGPVATLRGLYNIFNFKDPGDKQNLFLLQQFGKTTEKLDDVLKELTFLLDLNKNTEQLKEKIDIANIIENIKQLLSREITEKSAEILVEINMENDFRSIPIYINNMFYNIVGNALKYSSRERPVILISCVERLEEVVIKIKDNGKGIDLNKYGEKLFLPFQRFMPHIDGKGLGLFITKAQVESLGGTIQVESEESEGTCFTLTFPKNYPFVQKYDLISKLKEV